VLLSGALWAGCSNNHNGHQREDYQGVVKAMDDVGPGEPGGKKNPPPTAEVPGVDVSKLDDRAKQRFAGFLDSLQSPCGKTQSLRKSLLEDQSCKRAPFAARYLAMLVDEDLEDLEVRAAYDGRYRDDDKHEFDLSKAPSVGPRGAPIVLVEFFDYGCPHCAAFRSILDEVIEAYPNDVVVYFKHFPLSGHVNSEPAARAAMAAARQGKFREMHELLFEHQEEQSAAQLLGYAEQIGLDMTRFQADFADKGVAALIAADKEEGIQAGVEGTPALYINGKNYTDPLGFPFLKDWIDEYLAVNR